MKFYNDYDFKTDCQCILSVEHEFVSNDNYVGMIGEYKLKNVIRFQMLYCKEHNK